MLKTYKNDYTNVNTYNPADCGMVGKGFESCFTGKYCKPSMRVDRYLNGRKCEIKTGAGELFAVGKKTLAHCNLVLYCPVVVVDADGYIDPYKQEAFFLSKESFLEALTEAGAIREKTTTAKQRKFTIQTFWNRSKNKPHGALLYRILDAMYDHCEATLEEVLGE